MQWVRAMKTALRRYVCELYLPLTSHWNYHRWKDYVISVP